MRKVIQMTVDKKWEIQNKLYLMKARKLELEHFLKQTEKDIEFMKNFNLFERDKDIKFLEFISMVVFIFILHLDKIFDFYYMKYRAFNIIKSAKKEILTLTKEIKYYEQY